MSIETDIGREVAKLLSTRRPRVRDLRLYQCDRSNPFGMRRRVDEGIRSAGVECEEADLVGTHRRQYRFEVITPSID